MITEKVGGFKDFSGGVFPEKMQVIHRLDALCREVVHNILWFVGKSGTSFPGSMRLFLHFRVKMCGIAHSVFSGKILRSGKCTGKRENCGETGHQREARKGVWGTGAHRALWAMKAGGASEIARSDACVATMRVSRTRAPERVWDRSRARPVGGEARRSVWKRKGALARLFRFPGRQPKIP